MSEPEVIKGTIPTDRLRDRIRLLEVQATAKEIAAKTIGRSAVPWIVFLVLTGVVAAHYLPQQALTAVIGLVATATMALISMLSGITGAKETPEFAVIANLIDRLDKTDIPLSVEIEGNRVTVTKGTTRIVSHNIKDEPDGKH